MTAQSVSGPMSNPRYLLLPTTGRLGQAVLLAVVGALLAGIYPAWRMSRTSPALALRGE